MKKNNFFILLFLLSLLIVSSAFSQETITVTTYYPSPSGVYENLRFFPTTAVPACDANNEGITYYDNTTNLLMVCRQTGIAPNTYGFQSASSLWTRIGTTGPNGIDPRAISPIDNNLKVGIGDINVGWNRQNRLAVTDNTSTNGLGEQIALMEILNPRRGNSGAWSGAGDSVTALLLSPGAAAWQVRADEFSPADGAFMIHEADIPAARLVIRKGTGNVGIGTTNPTTNLEIASGVPLIGNMGFGVNRNQAWLDMWYDGGTNGHFAIANTSPLNTGGTEFVRNVNGTLTRGLLYIGNDGNIGIGTTQPQYEKLDVVHGIRFGASGTGGRLYAENTNFFGTTKEVVLTVADGNGGANDLIWIGPNTGGRTGHVILSAKSIGFDATPGGTVTVSGAFINNSDISMKKDIVPVPNALNRIIALNGINFRWKEDGINQHLQMGLVAQDVEKSFPELVYTDKDGKKSIAYIQLTGALVEAIKELKKDNSNLKQKIDALEREIKTKP